MQENTSSDKSHILKQTTLANPYCAVPATILPRELLNEDGDLQDIAHRGRVCFARIERQVCEDLFRIRIAADPSRLDGDDHSHLLFVSPEELCAISEIIQIASTIVPRSLLKEDRALEQVVRQDRACFARIEHQVDWDLYYIRIAADPRLLDDNKCSHFIYVSLSELQSHTRNTRAQPQRTDLPNLTNSSVPIQCKDAELKVLRGITISEEDIRKAAETLPPLKENAFSKKQRPSSKHRRWLRRLIDFVLYRAVLAVLQYQHDLQNIVRQVWQAQRKLGKRLISIRDMHEEDHHTYWSIQVNVPSSLLQTSAI